MKERKKPTQSWIGRSIEEIENEAFKIGYEDGFAKACEIVHDFAWLVYKMRERQKDKRDHISWLLADLHTRRDMEGSWKLRCDFEEAVDTWIKENYPHFEEE